MNAYIFDVDGVITSLQEKQVKEIKILEIISKLLKNQVVAFNTGRDLKWVTERVINLLVEKIDNKNILQNLFIVGEKGGTWLTFDESGNMIKQKDKSILMPQTLQDKLKNLAREEFSDYVFYDENKETMISLEIKDDLPLEEFNRIHPLLDEKIFEILNQENVNDNINLVSVTLSTDIESKSVGKDFGAKRILKWINEKGLKPEKFITIGDSKPDIEMAEEIYKQGLEVEYVSVGNNNFYTDKNYPFKITFTKNHYDKGTLEYFGTN